MNHIDGRSLRGTLQQETDVIVVGSGPAGASVAREAARAGARVVVVEAGPAVDLAETPRDAFGAMALLYRQMGTSVVLGSSPMPYLQGRMVGGSSPINGAICWRLPRDVHGEWCAADPTLAEALPWAALESLTDEIETRLGVTPTDPRIAGPKNLLMARGADALGLEHRPMRRNVQGCEGLGQCLQGCPRGRKQSVDGTLLADALHAGATLISSTDVKTITLQRGRAVGVAARAASGSGVEIRARHAVVLAASAIQTPVLLLRSGLRHGPVGEHFQCHPGVSMLGRFSESVRMWEGATQGHEVIGLRHEGLKFEVLGFGLAVLAARLDGIGTDLARSIADMSHWIDWGVAVRAQAHGRVRVVCGHTVVTYSVTPHDVARFRRGLRVLGEMMLAAGAEVVRPSARGFPPEVREVAELVRLERDGPRRASAFTGAITHMFGTCRMGSDTTRNVVRPDFRHHTTEALYVADSSVFPTNLGVNPQVPIMAMAALCARRMLGVDPQTAPERVVRPRPGDAPQ